MPASLPFLDPSQVPWQDLGGGVRRKIIGHTPQLMTVLVEFERGAVGAVHHHEIHDQISYVLRGAFEVQVGSQKRRLEVGEVFIAAHPAPHGVVALEAGSLLLDVFSPRRDDFL